MAHIVRDADNVRESFTSTGTTIIAGGAVANSRALSSVLANGDTFFGVARKGAEFSVGIFTWSTGGSIAQTTVWYSTNGNAAVSFSSGTGEIFMDAPSRLFDELNLKEITVASATTCDIGAVHGGKVLISGTTTITGLGSTTIDKRRFVRFSGVLTLTHHATSLILPGGANITTAAGDTACFLQDASGNWRCSFYQKANGKAVIGPASTDITDSTSVGRSILTAVDAAAVRSAAAAAGLGVANNFTDATEATGAGTTAAAIFAGGLEILKKLFVTGIAKFTANQAATNTTSGSVQVTGGIGASGAGYFGGLLSAVGGLKTPVVAGTTPALDAGGQTVLSVNGSGANGTIVAGAGYAIIIVSEVSSSGNTAIFIAANTSVALVAQASGSSWAAGTSPGAGYSVGYATSAYRIYNGTGGAKNFAAVVLNIS